MRLVKKNSQFCVFDNFLSPEMFKLVLNYIQDENYQSVHAKRWDKLFRLSDGPPLKGSAVFSDRCEGMDRIEHKVYPTKTGIDILIEHLLSHAEEFTEWIGRKRIDWEIFTAKAFLFPQGTSLSWHDDGMGKTGSYIFYAHPDWNVQWGGELFVADEAVKNIKEPPVDVIGSPTGKVVGQHFDNTYENQKLLEVSVGHYVIPKPNQLVILAAGNPHMINRVSPAAGNHVRCSISGFFLKTRSESQ